ncbi:MAG: chitobiase/beta-hexosaminidase C-terminal domain-containing protein, partial [Caulobacteraceae bacterium]
RLDWDDFLARLPRDLDRTRSLGLEPDRGALRVKITASPGETPGTTGISLSNQLGLGEIRYTLDGSAPGPRSMAYGGPFDAAQEDRLNAQSFLDGRALASAAEQRLGPPQRRVSQELELCTDTLSLDLEGVASPVEPRPIYLVDIMNPCWIWRGADLDGIGSIKIAAAPLPFNFQLGAEAAKIALRTPRDASGDIVIHLDSCAGPLLADLPMGDARPKEGARLYEAPIAPSAGRHDLCIESERAHVDPLIVLDWVELEPAAGGPGR